MSEPRDARDVIEKALHDRHMADQNDPVLGGGDALRLNAHLYAFAVLEALTDAGYAVVRKSQILVDAFGEPELIEEVRPGVTMYTWPAEDDE